MFFIRKSMFLTSMTFPHWYLITFLLLVFSEKKYFIDLLKLAVGMLPISLIIEN